MPQLDIQHGVQLHQNGERCRSRSFDIGTDIASILYVNRLEFQMEWLGVIVIGFIVGLLARFLKPGDDRMGIVVTTLVGIGGALLGTFIGQAMGIYQSGEPAGFLGAVIGAIIVLAILKMVLGRK